MVTHAKPALQGRKILYLYVEYQTKNMERPLLNDRNIPVTGEILRKTLGDSYPVYEKMIETITGKDYELVPEWRYYNDGKAWLCKMVYKKKTVFWLSVWDGFFKTSFYFVERHCRGLAGLDVEKSIKDQLKSGKTFGTLFPVTLRISKEEQIRDLLKIVEYKKKLK
jgi:hypothetical protein